MSRFLSKDSKAHNFDSNMITPVQDAEIETIKEALGHGKLVPVIGAGVSTATAGLPSWPGIVESALQHAERIGFGTNEMEIGAARATLARKDLPAAARLAKKLLGAPDGEYPTWLKRQFDVSSNDIRSDQVIQKIFDLRAPLLATTNYDKILSNESIVPVTAISWLHAAKMQTALREKGHVLHLHGIFDEPQSAVFGDDDYENIVSSEPYQSVLRALWLDRTLLFIGCSFDGLDDPDFNALLNWAAKTFKGTPYKHYALMRQGAFDAPHAAELLKNYRIQVITYGPDFNCLPKALEQLNDDPEASLNIRFAQAIKILEMSDTSKAADFQRALKGLMSSDIDSPQLQKDFSLQATNLLENRRNSVQKLRQALISFQAIAESIISVKELAHLNEKWRVGKVQVYGGSFRDAVNRAYGLLGLLEYNFIVELRQRGVMGIHPYWLDGHLQMEYLLLKRAMGDTRRDIYGIENANRILCTLRAICEAEANDIFPVPISGLAKTNLRGGHILITRSDSLELRPIDVPEEISATLPLGVPPPRQAEAVKIHGDVTIVAHDDQRIFLWDPRRASTPYQEWTPPPDDGTWIKYAVHQETFEGLRTVAILPGSVIELRDLAFHKEYEVDRSVRSPICLAQCPHSFFAVAGNSDAVSIVRVEQDGSQTTVFTKDKFQDLVKRHPVVSRFYDQKQQLDGQEDIEWHQEVQFQAFHVKKGQLGEREVLIARLKIWFLRSTPDDVLVFLDPSEKEVVRGLLYLKDASTITFGQVDGEAQVIGLLHTHGEQDSLVWAKSLETPHGLIFVREKSLWKHDRDLLSLVMTSRWGFASDDQGALFKVNLEQMTVSPVAVNPESYIEEMKILEL